MYQIGDQVIYGIHGVCWVKDLEERVIDRKTVSYLVLEPVGQDGARYLVPTHNHAAMSKVRKILTQDELTALLHAPDIRMDTWITDENLRKQTYRNLIGSGDRIALMQMLFNLYRHKAEQQRLGKKMHQCDDNFLRDMEKLMAEEISVVMHMERPQAIAFLREKLNG